MNLIIIFPVPGIEDRCDTNRDTIVLILRHGKQSLAFPCCLDALSLRQLSYAHTDQPGIDDFDHFLRDLVQLS